MTRASLVVATSVICAALMTAQSKTLDIYVLDVEGGNATLVVTPLREAVLIDTGNGGSAAPRDADRIMAAVKDAGLAQIDVLVTSPWHGITWAPWPAATDPIRTTTTRAERETCRCR